MENKKYNMTLEGDEEYYRVLYEDFNGDYDKMNKAFEEYERRK